MNIEEARKVLWLKSYPRPLGELLDEGYLNRERLEWAAKRAYNPKLKQVAQIPPDEMNKPVPIIGGTIAQITEIKETLAASEIPISLEKGWFTPWPFSPYKGLTIQTNP